MKTVMPDLSEPGSISAWVTEGVAFVDNDCVHGSNKNSTPVTLKSQVAKGLKWQVINIGGKQLLSLVVFTTLARLLEPAAFGLVGLVGVYLGFISMFADQGIGAALIQRRILEPEHMDVAFWCNLACSAFLCAGTIILAGPVARLLGDARLAPLLRWSSLVLILNAASAIHSNLLLKEMNFRSPTIRTLIANAVGGAIGVSMALDGFGVWALIAQQLFAAGAGTIFLWSVSAYRPTFRFSMRHFRELSSVGWSIFATSLLWFFTSRLDQMVIGRFIGIPTLGLYVIGNKVPDMAKTLTQNPLESISLPALSRLQDNNEKMCGTIYKGMELNATISFAIFIGIASISSDLVPFLFGPKWEGAITFSILLSIYALVNVLQVFFHPVLLACGGARKYIGFSIWNAIGSATSCALGVFLGIPFLIVGLTVTSMIVAIPTLIYLRGKIGLSLSKYWTPCIVPALASLFMVGVVCLLSILLPGTLRPAILIFSKICAGAVAYISFIFVFKRDYLIKIADTVGHAIGGASRQDGSRNRSTA